MLMQSPRGLSPAFGADVRHRPMVEEEALNTLISNWTDSRYRMVPHGRPWRRGVNKITSQRNQYYLKMNLEVSK